MLQCIVAHFLKLIRDDSNFRHRLNRKVARLAQLEKMTGGTGNQEIGKVLMDVLRMCDFNAALLVPYFFPAYPKELPLSLSRRPFQAAFMDVQVGGYITAVTGRQSGKCIKHNTLLQTRENNTTGAAIKTAEEVYLSCKRLGKVVNDLDAP